MSDLDDMELDLTLLHNKAFSKYSLEELKEKYKDYPEILKEINERIEEIEDEYDR